MSKKGQWSKINERRNLREKRARIPSTAAAPPRWSVVVSEVSGFCTAPLSRVRFANGIGLLMAIGAQCEITDFTD
jgi:hypothetical protein